MVGSPLALAFTTRAMGRYCLGRPAWRDDLRHGVAMARNADPLSYAMVVAYAYFPGIPFNVLAAHDRVVREDAVRIAERSGDDMALAFARTMLGIALVHRHPDAERNRGQNLLAEASDVLTRRGHNLSELRLINVYLAGERARRGDRDEAIPLMFAAVDQLIRERQMVSWGIPATGCSGGDTARSWGRGSATRAAGQGPRRRCCLPGLREPLPRDGGIAWLRGTYRLGQSYRRRDLTPAPPRRLASSQAKSLGIVRVAAR